MFTKKISKIGEVLFIISAMAFILSLVWTSSPFLNIRVLALLVTYILIGLILYKYPTISDNYFVLQVIGSTLFIFLCGIYADNHPLKFITNKDYLNNIKSSTVTWEDNLYMNFLSKEEQNKLLKIYDKQYLTLEQYEQRLKEKRIELEKQFDLDYKSYQKQLQQRLK